MLCIVRDVTEQVRTEDALRASEERYRTVVEALAEGILIHDPEGAVYACNRSATLILGVRETDLLGSDTGCRTSGGSSRTTSPCRSPSCRPR